MLCRQGGTPGNGVQDLLDEKILKKKIVAALEPKRLSLRPYREGSTTRPTDDHRGCLTYGHRMANYIADTVRLVHAQLDAGRTVVFEGAQGATARHRPRDLSVVTSSNPGAGESGMRQRRRRAEGHRRGLGSDQGLRDARGRRAVPDRARRRHRRRDSRARRRERHHDRPRAAGRMARPGRAALRRPDQLADAAGGDEARYALRVRAAWVCTRYRGPEGAEFATSPTTRRCSSSGMANTSAARMERGPDRVPRRVRPVRRPRAITCSSSRTSSACRSR